MKVNRAAFLMALHNVKPALGKKLFRGKEDSEDEEGFEDLDGFGRYFIFSDGQVCAYNGELYITTPLPEGLDAEGVVPAKELTDLVRMKKTDKQEVTTEEEKLFLSAEKMKVKLVRVPDIKGSVWDMIEPAEDSWNKVPEDFKEKLKTCLFTAAKSKNNPILTCIHWKNQLLESCDNTRITRCTISDTVPEDIDILIPIETASALRLKIYDLSQFAITEDWLHFKCFNGTSLSCRLYASKFPPIDQIFSMNFGKRFRLPAKSIPYFDESRTCAEEDPLSEPFVQVEIRDGLMNISASNFECPEFEESEPINSNESIQFWINPRSLIEILKKDCDCVALSEQSENFPERFLRFEGKDFTHIIGVAPAEDVLLALNASDTAETDIRPPIDLGPVEMYCAGSLGFEFNHEKLRAEMDNRLLSYAYRTTDLDRYPNEYRESFNKLMIDSGAFSVWTKGGEIDLDEYIRYCLSHDKIDYFVSLDVIPGSPGQKNLRLLSGEIERSASKGYKNYTKMLEAGVPKEKLIHVFHQGEHFKWLRRMVQDMNYIGLSPGNDRTTEEKIEWLIKCMEYVTDSSGRPIVRFHGFAVTSLRLVKLFPWASIDSATWGILAGMGRAMIPYRRNDRWDFSSDTPLQYPCSHAKNHPEHVDNLPPLEQKRVVDYFKDLGLKMGKSEFVVREKSYTRKENERRVTKKLGERIALELGPTVIERMIEEAMGRVPSFKEPGPNEKWVEIVKEPGVINSYYLRGFLNIYYFKQFLKTLPEDRRFVRPKNRVDLYYFMTGSHDVEVASVTIPSDSEETRPAPSKRIVLPFPKLPEELRKRPATKPSKNLSSSTSSPARDYEGQARTVKGPYLTDEAGNILRFKKGEHAGKLLTDLPWEGADKKGGGNETDSVEKIIGKYFWAVSKVPFRVAGVTVHPGPLRISHLLGRGYTCPEHCGACCRAFSLDYITGERMPEEGLTERSIEFNGQQIKVLSDLQLQDKKKPCKYVRPDDGRCSIHSGRRHPFTCDFELVRCVNKAKSEGRFEIGVLPYGHSTTMKRVHDGGKGVLCATTEPTNKSVRDTMRKLKRLKKWTDHFGLTETHIPEIIKLLWKNRNLAEWEVTLFPNSWTEEERETFLAKTGKRGR